MPSGYRIPFLLLILCVDFLFFTPQIAHPLHTALTYRHINTAGSFFLTAPLVRILCSRIELPSESATA